MKDFTQPIENELISNKIEAKTYEYWYIGSYCNISKCELKDNFGLWYCDIKTYRSDMKNKYFTTKKEALQYFIAEINYTL
tara:strand:+ start:107 stop:346 length:240 start_codon:yes stop_codon:yes gene_type:complete